MAPKFLTIKHHLNSPIFEMYLLKDKLLYQSNRKGYCQYSLSQRTSTEITLEQYCENLFGTYNYKLRNLLGYSLSIGLNSIYSSSNQSLNLLELDKKGKLKNEEKGFFSVFKPYDIQVVDDRNEIWVTTGSGQVLFCYDLSSKMLEKTTIGVPYEDNGD